MSEEPLVSLQKIVGRVIDFLPALIAGFLVLLVGLLLAWITARVVSRLLILLRIHHVAERLRWGGALRKGDVRHTVISLLGSAAGTLVFLVFLDKALGLWGLTVLSQLLERLVFLVPALIVCLFIVIIGLVIGAMVERGVRHALYEEEVVRASLISRLVRAGILVFAVSIALMQLGLATELVKLAFAITFGALALSFVLAFGLGSRRAVELMWEEVLQRPRKEVPEVEDSEIAPDS
jgi:hypothetical protein